MLVNLGGTVVRWSSVTDAPTDVVGDIETVLRVAEHIAPDQAFCLARWGTTIRELSAEEAVEGNRAGRDGAELAWVELCERYR